MVLVIRYFVVIYDRIKDLKAKPHVELKFKEIIGQ
jgi:hypothetical protein